MTEFDLSSIGKPTESSVSTLEADAGIAYAKATNDPTPAHLDGTYIPPIYGVVPVWEKVFEVVTAVVPEEHFFSVVHGEQDMIFHSPLKAGITLSSIAIGQSVSVKDSGTTLVVKSESYDDQTKELVLEQYFTMFFRGVDGGQSVGVAHSMGLDLDNYNSHLIGYEDGADSEAYIGSVDNHMDEDQTMRYAQASGDFMPIHIDDEFAKSVGLGGIIIHGLCTMAGASWAAISELCDNDPTRLVRIATRFSKPLRPGDDLRTTFFEGQQAQNPNANGFYFVSKRVADSETILTNSLVEVLK